MIPDERTTVAVADGSLSLDLLQRIDHNPLIPFEVYRRTLDGGREGSRSAHHNHPTLPSWRGRSPRYASCESRHGSGG